jgi:uncharacterized membrane protein YgcG
VLAGLRPRLTRARRRRQAGFVAISTAVVVLLAGVAFAAADPGTDSNVRVPPAHRSTVTVDTVPSPTVPTVPTTADARPATTAPGSPPTTVDDHGANRGPGSSNSGPGSGSSGSGSSGSSGSDSSGSGGSGSSGGG